MDPSRRSARHLDSRDDANYLLDNGAPGRLTNDSGRGTTPASGRSSSGVPTTTSGASSSLSIDTPLGDSHQSNEPVRIRRAPILEGKCYEQAYVSHIDHPSAFFIQLAHFQDEYKDLLARINDFYPTNPRRNPAKWKRGDYCIAQFTDGMFYRGRIIEGPEVTEIPDVYDVVFLDYGNWDGVNLSNIHLLLPEFATLPAQAVPCSLTKSLPTRRSWHDNPDSIKSFKDLVFEKYVDATIVRKTPRDYWPLTFVDVCLSSSKANIRECMKNQRCIREVTNDQIYHEFGGYLRPQDYIIYSIPHENDDNSDADEHGY